MTGTGITSARESASGAPVPRLILGSASPRRLALLRQAGIEPDLVVSPALDETAARGELPRDLARRLAREKVIAASCSPAIAGSCDPCILCADTVVAVGRRILPKAETEAEAEGCLRLLSGRGHRVFTAVAVWRAGRLRERLVETRLHFKRLSERELALYVQAGEWRGKAGGYAIQGLAGSFVHTLVGSYSAVVGLPLYEAVSLLEGSGYPVRQGWAVKGERTE